MLFKWSLLFHLFDLIYSFKDIGDEYFLHSYSVEGKQEGQYHLESHHSHFLLLDHEQSNDNIHLVASARARLEKSFRFSSDSNELIPSIVILIEGGSSSIKTICQALEENTPILVIKVKSIESNIFIFISFF